MKMFKITKLCDIFSGRSLFFAFRRSVPATIQAALKKTDIVGPVPRKRRWSCRIGLINGFMEEYANPTPAVRLPCVITCAQRSNFNYTAQNPKNGQNY